MSTLILILLVLIILGAFPAWPHSKSWGYFPSGTAGLLLLVLIVLLVFGRI